MKSKHKARVLLLVENNPYPQDIRVYQEAMALKANDYTVSTISPAKKNQPLHERIDGVEVFRYPPPPASNNYFGYILEYGWSLAAMFILSLRVLVRPGFDILHIANPPDILVLIGIIYKILGKRLIYDHHDLAPELFQVRFGGKSNRFIHMILIFFEKLSCQCANHIITVNESHKALEIQRNRVRAEKITVVRNGPPKSLDQAKPLQDIKVAGKTALAYVGIIGFQDGVDHLIRALHHIVYGLGRKDFHCTIVGDGDAIKIVMPLATDLKLDKYIHFTGWVEHALVARYLCSADICVAPEPSNDYNNRSTSIKIMEYMAAGKPIVAFDLPEHRISAGKSALFAQPNDDKSFGAHIVTLMDDPERRQILGQFGRKRIEEELAWEHQAKLLIKAYEKVQHGSPL
jgi:glycosyltransferase involved in cell wall biosynthesis